MLFVELDLQGMITEQVTGAIDEVRWCSKRELLFPGQQQHSPASQGFSALSLMSQTLLQKAFCMADGMMGNQGKIMLLW